jgi:hypothetical protein
MSLFRCLSRQCTNLICKPLLFSHLSSSSNHVSFRWSSNERSLAIALLLPTDLRASILTSPDFEPEDIQSDQPLWAIGKTRTAALGAARKGSRGPVAPRAGQCRQGSEDDTGLSAFSCGSSKQSKGRNPNHERQRFRTLAAVRRVRLLELWTNGRKREAC